jgi:hypothetical protein
MKTVAKKQKWTVLHADALAHIAQFVTLKDLANFRKKMDEMDKAS